VRLVAGELRHLLLLLIALQIMRATVASTCLAEGASDKTRRTTLRKKLVMLHNTLQVDYLVT
jgi:hypothetical protein